MPVLVLFYFALVFIGCFVAGLKARSFPRALLYGFVWWVAITLLIYLITPA